MNLQITEKTPAESPTTFPAERLRTNRSAAERNEPAALTMDERGMIKDCSRSFELLAGYRRSELVWHHVSMVFPQLDEIELVQAGQINPKLNYLCRCGQIYRLLNRLGDSLSSNINLFTIENGGKKILRLIVHPLESAQA
ncbi:MAG: PAS domain-containing protein [Gammaproteobacteria bacterium]|nr:PAS domain-containing protein [Gammaproteobacteria bacterium]MBU1480078.1 PAS domain-containing protein [Gammaproteobacteria bacterium]